MEVIHNKDQIVLLLEILVIQSQFCPHSIVKFYTWKLHQNFITTILAKTECTHTFSSKATIPNVM